MKEKKEKQGTSKTRYEDENEKWEQMKKRQRRKKKRGNTWNEVEGGERTNIKGTEYNIDKPLKFRIKMLCH